MALLSHWPVLLFTMSSTSTAKTVVSLTNQPRLRSEENVGDIDSTKSYPYEFQWKSINTARAEIEIYAAGVREVELWARARQINDSRLGNIGPTTSSPWVQVESIITKAPVTTHRILLDPIISSPIEICVGSPNHEKCQESAVIFPTHALVGIGPQSEIQVMSEQHRDLLRCTSHAQESKRCHEITAAQLKSAQLSDGRMSLRSYSSAEPTAKHSFYCIAPIAACRKLQTNVPVKPTWNVPFHRLTELSSPVFEATHNDSYDVNELTVKHNNSAHGATLSSLPGQLLITSTSQSPKIIVELLQPSSSDDLIQQSDRLVRLVLLWEALQLNHEPFLSWRKEQQRVLEQLLSSQGQGGLWSTTTEENIAVLDALLHAHEQGFISSSHNLLSAISALCHSAPDQLRILLENHEESDWEGVACLGNPKVQSETSQAAPNNSIEHSKNLAATLANENYTHIYFSTTANGEELTGRVHTWQQEHIQHHISSEQELKLKSHGTGTLYWALLSPKKPLLGASIPQITGGTLLPNTSCVEAKLGDRITLTADLNITPQSTEIGWQHSAGLSHSRLGPVRWIQLTETQQKQGKIRITEHTLAAHKGTFRVPSPLVNHTAITQKEQCITIH